jgi:hypothetical protein
MGGECDPTQYGIPSDMSKNCFDGCAALLCHVFSNKAYLDFDPCKKALVDQLQAALSSAPSEEEGEDGEEAAEGEGSTKCVQQCIDFVNSLSTWSSIQRDCPGLASNLEKCGPNLALQTDPEQPMFAAPFFVRPAYSGQRLNANFAETLKLFIQSASDTYNQFFVNMYGTQFYHSKMDEDVLFGAQGKGRNAPPPCTYEDFVKGRSNTQGCKNACWAMKKWTGVVGSYARLPWSYSLGYQLVKDWRAQSKSKILGEWAFKKTMAFCSMPCDGVAC